MNSKKNFWSYNNPVYWHFTKEIQFRQKIRPNINTLDGGNKVLSSSCSINSNMNEKLGDKNEQKNMS